MKTESKLSPQILSNIIEVLLTQPHARKSPSGRELSFRCPFCGDSVSDQYATSFYVNVDPESSRLLSYHCFRAACNSSGMVDGDFLSTLGLYDRDITVELNKFKSNKIVVANGKVIIRKPKELINIMQDSNLVTDTKLDYINGRLGLNLTYKDLYNLKISMSLNDLLKFNNIKVREDKELYYENLSMYGISFLSAYNDYVIVRDITKTNKLKRRYTNVNVFDNYENVTKMYSIPTSIGKDLTGLTGLLTPNPVVINVTEGIFDILGVYYHLAIDRKYENHIFAAACGSGIIKTIKHFITQYGLINCKINIFSDSDVDVSKYQELEYFKRYLIKPDITVYYNTLDKDFGVDKNKIKIVKSKL